MGWLFVVLAMMMLLLGNCCSLEKRWLPDLDWYNPSNWFDGLIPDADARIVFPVEMRHAAGMPRNSPEIHSLTGFELPRDGILALPEEAKIIMNEKSDGVLSHWLRDAAYFWVDPTNWDSHSEATPHLERLPCQGDVVILPSSSKTFSMRLPQSRMVEVQEIRLADDNESLARFEWRSMNDKLEFMAADGTHGASGFTVKYSPLMGCENCRCQEGDLAQYSEEVCDVQRPRCGFLACEFPLQVEGHCCYYCGGRVKLSKKTLVSTAKRVASNILQSFADSIDWHARLTWDENNVEILIAEKGTYEGTNTLIAIADLETKLKERNIEVLYTETSGGALQDNRVLMILAPLTASLIVLIIFFVITCMTFGYTLNQIWSVCCEMVVALFEDTMSGDKKKKKKTFAFARFENVSEGNVLLTEEENKEAQQAESSSGERFENPLYRSKRRFSNGKSQQSDDKLNFNEAISLTGLQKAIELDPTDDTESIQMDIENL